MNRIRLLFVFLILFLTITFQPAAALLERIASQGSLVKVVTGEETNIWQKIKAGLFAYTQLDDIRQLKEDTEQLIKKTADIIKSNIDTIEKIQAAQAEMDKKQPTKPGKKTTNTSFWVNQIQKIKKEILDLQARAIKELSNLDIKEFIDPNTRSSFMDIITKMNDSFDSVLDVIPQPIQDQLFDSTKRRAKSTASTTSSNPYDIENYLADIKPEKSQESSSWNYTAQQPATRASSPKSPVTPQKPSLTKKTSTTKPATLSNKKLTTGVDPNDL